MDSDYDEAASTDIIDNFYLTKASVEGGWRLEMEPIVCYHTLEVLKQEILQNIIPAIDLLISEGEV